MNKIRHLAVAALGMSVVALAGCPSADVDPEPSILFAGFADGIATVTEGESTILYWQTRLAEEVVILEGGAGGQPISLANCIPDIGAGNLDLLGGNADDDPGECLQTGAIELSPDADTDYVLRALRGEGDCSRRDGVGDLVHPTQCEEWNISSLAVGVAPAATAEWEAETLAVTAGAPATVGFTATNAAELSVGVFIEAASEEEDDQFLPCDEEDTGESVCTYTYGADEADPTAGEVTITVEEDTTLLLEVLNGADDGIGDAEDTILLTVGGV